MSGSSCRSIQLDGHREKHYAYLRPRNKSYVKIYMPSLKKTCDKYIFRGFVLMSFVSIVISSTVLYYMTKKNVELSDDYCVPCDDIKFSPSPNENEKYRMLDKDYENGIEICCASTPFKTNALLDLIAERKFKEEETKELESRPKNGYFKGSQISAHVLMAGNGNNPNVLKLVANRTLNHYNGVKINYPTNRIIIERKGRYFVYSQVYYRAMQENMIHVSQGILTHTIMRYNFYGGKDKLLQSSVTLKVNTSDPTDHDFQSVYSSGVYDLKIQDEIYMIASNPEVISLQPEKNYIGLFLIAED